MNTPPSLFAEPAPPQPEPSSAEVRVRVTTLPLPGGRALRLAAMDGALVLADGFGDDRPLQALARGLAIPVELWPAVVAAAAALLEGEGI
jgi:hypothetical protein